METESGGSTSKSFTTTTMMTPTQQQRQRRRTIERTSSISSTTPQITSRRDSLFGGAGGGSDDDDDNGDAMPQLCHLPEWHPMLASTPRRRFSRRNGFCHFQLIQDAVHASIALNSLDISEHGVAAASSSGQDDDYDDEDDDSSAAHRGPTNGPHTPGFTRHHEESHHQFRTAQKNFLLPMIHETPSLTSSSSLESYNNDYHYMTGTTRGGNGQSCKVSKTSYRLNPSNDAMYSESSTL